MPKEKCSTCNQYDKQGDNYCRKCGYHLTVGQHPRSRVLIGYHTDEKFCGYCGGKRTCGCYNKSSNDQ